MLKKYFVLLFTVFLFACSEKKEAVDFILHNAVIYSVDSAFTTYEAADLGFLSVIKKSGKRQRYSRAKLFSSIYGAFASGPYKQADIDAVTDTVEAKLLDVKTPELATKDIARTILITLKHFNTGAFLRYLADQTELASDAQLKRELKKYT